MEAATYTALARQTGLMREMQIIANNMANSSTTGFRQEGIIFSEYVMESNQGDYVAMPASRIGNSLYAQGEFKHTGGALDLAIEGDGFFLIETPEGERLSRAGSFSATAAGELVTHDGYPVLDTGGAPVFLPGNVMDLQVAADGTVSADGQPVGQIGVFAPVDQARMVREGGVVFRADEGWDPVENPMIKQGYVEDSNVNQVLQIARMIEVQRAYETGQKFLEREDERIRSAVKTIIGQG